MSLCVHWVGNGYVVVVSWQISLLFWQARVKKVGSLERWWENGCCIRKASGVFFLSFCFLHYFSDKYIVGTIEAWTISHFSNSPPFSAAFWLESRSPFCDTFFNTMTFTSTSQTFSLSVRRAQCTHLLSWNLWYESYFKKNREITRG